MLMILRNCHSDLAWMCLIILQYSRVQIYQVLGFTEPISRIEEVLPPEGEGLLPECLEDHEDVEGVLCVHLAVMVEVKLTLIAVE